MGTSNPYRASFLGANRIIDTARTTSVNHFQIKATLFSVRMVLQALINFLLYKKWSFPLRISSVKFTEEILNGKLYFLYSVYFAIFFQFSLVMSLLHAVYYCTLSSAMHYFVILHYLAITRIKKVMILFLYKFPYVAAPHF